MACVGTTNKAESVASSQPGKALAELVGPAPHPPQASMTRPVSLSSPSKKGIGWLGWLGIAFVGVLILGVIGNLL